MECGNETFHMGNIQLAINFLTNNEESVEESVIVGSLFDCVGELLQVAMPINIID